MLLAFTRRDSFKNTMILITAESQLTINGKTNVNKFQCIYNTIELQEPIPVYYEIKDNSLIFKNTQLILKTNCFDCGNKTMNKIGSIPTNPNNFKRTKESKNSKRRTYAGSIRY